MRKEVYRNGSLDGYTAYTNITHVLKIQDIFLAETAPCDKGGTIVMVSDDQEKLALILAPGCEHQYFARSGI